MSRLLYIAVRGQVENWGLSSAKRRRLYSAPPAAWGWARGGWNDEHHVYEIDLDEAMKLGDAPEQTAQVRYEHAERRATRWLALRDSLEPLVASGRAPSGDDIWKLPARDLAQLARVFDGWSRLKKLEAPRGPGDGLEVIADQALHDVLADLLAPVERGDLDNAELKSCA